MSGSELTIAGDIEIGMVSRLKKKLEVDDNLAKEGNILLANMCGDPNSPTIFKRESKADGHQELPKPRAVAIGPFRRENSSKFNDDYKWKITRFMVQKLSLDVGKYLEEMEEEEYYARYCYGIKNLSEWSSDDFLTMLLLDSSFILFTMDAFSGRSYRGLSGDLFSEYMALYLRISKHTKQIKLDLLIADNQIPFFAVEKLSECFRNEGVLVEYSIKELALSYFDDLWPKRNKEQTMDDGTEFDHLLHLFHRSRIPVEGYEKDIKRIIRMGIDRMDDEELIITKNASQEYIPSATELKKSAIKFEKKESGSNLDITFRRRFMKISAVINIPTVHLYDYSEEIFRNLIAFEGNPTNNVLCFTAYSACMSCLLQRKDDVKLLRESGTIASTSYNDVDVIKFFKDFNKEVEDREMPDTLLQLYGRVMEHHKSRVSNAYGDFRLQYCPNVWVGLSLVAASMLFILTLLQTIYAIMHK